MVAEATLVKHLYIYASVIKMVCSTKQEFIPEDHFSEGKWRVRKRDVVVVSELVSGAGRPRFDLCSG